MAFVTLIEASAPSNPGVPIYQGSVTAPSFGAFIPLTALPSYPPGTTYRRFIQTSGANGPITNGNLVVDLVQPGGQTEPLMGYAASTGPSLIVYTVAGGVLTLSLIHI